jgi:hypothetical protein
MIIPVSKYYLYHPIKQVDRSCGCFGGDMEIGLWWLKERKERLVRPRHRWEESIKMSFGEIGVIWHMTRGSSGCCDTVLNFHVP